MSQLGRLALPAQQQAECLSIISKNVPSVFSFLIMIRLAYFAPDLGWNLELDDRVNFKALTTDTSLDQKVSVQDWNRRPEESELIVENYVELTASSITSSELND
ncbi:hypothetical protein Pst134EB_028776 [Puccinia striiformis f. sp. tritici]|nr:hypothetical protein Pst134EB_028776 [Puccinia striiformis f. sp. tritici]